MFNSIAYWALLGADGWVMLAEEPAPIVVVEQLTGLEVDIAEAVRRFDLVLGPIECEARGICGLVWRPVHNADGSTSWSRSEIEGGVAPDGWMQWLEHLESIGIARDRVVGARCPVSIFLWFAFQEWGREQRGGQCAELLSSGGATLDEIREIARGGMDTDVFRRCVSDLAIRGALPQKKPGRPSTKTERVRRSVVELAALAADIRRRQPYLGLLPSYEAACLERPEWVLTTWRNGDPAGRLAKEVNKLRDTRWHKWFDHG